jgi:hypothetical protein
MWIWIILAVVVVLLVIFVIATYNKLVRANRGAAQAPK